MESILAAPLLAANVLTEWVWPILEFVIGMGLVVFVHELGHFLVAKAVGIKVEKFALGFGPRLFGIVRGDTDYCINALPLGGYVKMLGQEDFAPLKEGEKPDPRAYNNKSVGARFAVIAAGVVMNVILAGVLFIVVCMVGKNFPAPVVGDVIPGWPASRAAITWNQPAEPNAPEPNAPVGPAIGAPAGPSQNADSIGLKPGDRVLRINGEPIERFDILKIKALLADRDEMFDLDIERDSNGVIRTGTARLPVMTGPGGEGLAFGIEFARRPIISALDPSIEDRVPLKVDDRIVAINGQSVEHFWDIDPILSHVTRPPVTLDLLREGDDGNQIVRAEMRPQLRARVQLFYREDGTRVLGYPIEESDNRTTLLLPDGKQTQFPAKELHGALGEQMLDLLGMTPRLMAGTVEQGSPAETSGMKPGDVILSYADRATPTVSQLHDLNDEYVDKTTTLVVLRDGNSVSMDIRPKRRNGMALLGISPQVDMEHAVVAWVRPGSPAAKASLPAGAKLLSLRDADANAAAIPVQSWYDVYAGLLKLRGRNVELTYELGGQERTVSLGKLDTAAFDPDLYQWSLFPPGTAFKLLEVKIVRRNPLKAIAWGAEETGRMIISTYMSLKSLIQGTASTKSVMGPLGIGGLAVTASREGLIYLVYLMAFISAAVAVFNFLPFPVVDGGHAVFLLIEKIRGKPLPVKVTNAIQLVGLLLILGLFVAVTWQDLARLIGGMW